MTEFWCDVQRDVISVQGADAQSFLHGQISQDIAALGLGDSCYSFVLQPTGKIEALVRISHPSEDHFIIDLEPGFGQQVVTRLNRFKIRVKVDISMLDWRCVAVRGTAARPPGALAAWDLPDAVDLLGEDPHPPAGVAQGSVDQLDEVRIASGWPSMGAEITATSIPAETGVVDVAVNFTKGCYPGQELVERMDSRGSSAPRFVRKLRGSGSAMIGDNIVHKRAVVGTITSVANHDHGWLALGIVARAVALGDVVDVGLSKQVLVEASRVR